MANIKEQKLRRLKRSYTGGAMAAFIFIGMVIMASFAVMVYVFGIYIVDSKLRNEYQRAVEMASVYEYEEETGSAVPLFDDRDNEYIVTEKSGKIIKEKGTNTCDISSGGVIDIFGINEHIREDNDQDDLVGIEDSITVYPDKKLRVIIPGGIGRVRIDFDKFFEVINVKHENASDIFDTEGRFIKLPFWIDIPMSSGRHMICKAYFTVLFRELYILSGLVAAIALMTVVMLVFTLIFFCSNISKRKRMTEVFFMDETTGKHNWLWFLSNAERELNRRQSASHRYAVLDIVFVNYRNFCVCHSVQEGEKMLCAVYDVIQKHLGKRELAAHHSAAHFAALLTYSDQERLKERIEKMLRELETINEEHKFSFWVGVDLVERSVDPNRRGSARKNVDIEKEYNNAGAARATITGDESAVVFFDEKMVEEQRWIDTINESQEKALENEEFVVFYQPKYDPRTNKLKGAEALVRWMSPQHGMISPGRFIPLFEKNGFITKIDHYMLRHVVHDQRIWLDSGYSCVPVSVNVSRAHFIESDLAQQIRDIVDSENVPHNLIEIELTESAFFDDKNALITTIRELKAYGFTVSMDDFGSGYSSLNSLKEMPLDVLKLDADFFRNDDGEGRGRIVVSEAIKLAKNLNMLTVAEGVEEKPQVDFLADVGCDMIQGFYFAKPMPKEEFVQRMDGNDPAA